MKAQTLAAFGSASMALELRPVADVETGGVELRRASPAPRKEPAALDFTLAMRRVEAECYDSF